MGAFQAGLILMRIEKHPRASELSGVDVLVLDRIPIARQNVPSSMTINTARLRIKIGKARPRALPPSGAVST